ncbi:T9SS type A sorting domain-containing protein [Balneolaceae bacterium ANBcel3]|nr:T9SS type A sorting domain-containing protein [Balneolaceae bacterium ANBcel3]
MFKKIIYALLLATLSISASVFSQEPGRNIQHVNPDEIESITGGTSSSVQHIHRHKDHYDGLEPGEPIIHIPADFFLQCPDVREAYEEFLELHLSGQLEAQRKEVAQVYQVGDTRMFFTNNVGESTATNQVFDETYFELRAIGERTQIWVGHEEYQNGNVTDDVVDSMMESMEVRTPARSVNPDQGIILNNIDIFAGGNPANVPNPSGSGMVKVLLYDIQDGSSDEPGSGYVGGFFHPVDLAPNHPSSNQAAIIYINTRLLGLGSGEVRYDAANSTIAHEFQHLIHAGVGRLNTFMNEGQSELAEILNGYNARMMAFLNQPDEISGNVGEGAANGFFRWRSRTSEVFFDYQRAQLFHTYMFEQVGFEAAGSLTMSSSITRSHPWQQYEDAIDRGGVSLTFREMLRDFYIQNWLNGKGSGSWNYTTPQVSGTRMNIVSHTHRNDDRTWVQNERVSLQYGGAELTRWVGINSLELTLDSPSQITHTLITENSEGITEVIHLEQPEIILEGRYNEVVLLSVNSVVVDTRNYGVRNFHYDAYWSPGGLDLVELNYAIAPGDHPGPTYIVEIPFLDFDGIAVRISPEKDSRLLGVDLNQMWEPEGEGTLRTHITTSRKSEEAEYHNTRYMPNTVITYIDTPFDQIYTGVMSINFDEEEIWLDGGEEYHVLFQVIPESEDANMTFILDPGSEDINNTNYFPVRTLLSQNHMQGWATFLGDSEDENNNRNKNLWMSTRLLSEIEEREEVRPPLSDRFELVNNYPNPFNNQTVIELNVPAEVTGSSRVVVEIYDVIGRRVQTVADGDFQAGQHQLTFRAEGLPAGVYIARMQAGDQTDIRKMMYLK